MGVPHSPVAWIHRNIQKNTIIFSVAIYDDHLHLSKLQMYLDEVNSISSLI